MINRKFPRYVNTVNANVNEKINNTIKVSLLISTTTTKDSIVSEVALSKNYRKQSETDLNFVSNFFANSRLHHIGRYRAHLRPLIMKLHREKVQVVKPNRDIDRRKIIAHVDMDCFFASVALLRVGLICG